MLSYHGVDFPSIYPVHLVHVQRPSGWPRALALLMNRYSNLRLDHHWQCLKHFGARDFFSNTALADRRIGKITPDLSRY